ncbi:flagellar hook-basal body complex protein FliE [Sphingomonas gilva]|uniref:Flagellar hook-basal body complex protein FliE n=1 Tax=Sphingomonas gilva TaxID=2305907 RepID=A0A396RPH4_9SPHN|nr:flagellar hook-basal body complex protein FliE [Sphingomonas gilva]RHW18464.1 flagellar hook-basal body complex protein FliE [Sphingomonas gilva]
MSGIDASSILQMRNQILQQNAALQRVATAPVMPPAAPGAAAPVEQTGFTSALRDALTQVNSLQAASSEATAAYERGETTDIAAVMLAREQSSLGFQATLQVRNKLLTAYRDIMSMPV